MSLRNPASLLIDQNGNPVGVLFDGTAYRLQVQTTVADAEGNAAIIEVEGNRTAQAVSSPQLLAAVESIATKLDTILAQLAEITGEDDPL